MVTTKDQEKKALAKMKKIVDELGADSYIGTAFKGSFELAEQNIENDWGISMEEHAEYFANLKLKNLQEEAEERMVEAGTLMAQARQSMAEAEEMKGKFEIDRQYWGEVRRSLGWALTQITEKRIDRQVLDDIKRSLGRAVTQLSDKLGF